MFDARIQIDLYYNFLLVVVIISVFYLRDFPTYFYAKKTNSILPVLFCLSIICFIGIRDWQSNLFGDSLLYGSAFEVMDVDILNRQKDYGFGLFLYLCKKIMNVECFFLSCAFLYTFPLYLASKRISNKYTYYIFLFCVTSFSFFSYGTNGIRNGIATSLTFLAFTYNRYSLKQIILFIISFFFHASLFLPIAAYAIASKYKKTNIYLYIWIGSILISFFIGSIVKEYFLQIDFLKERSSGYLTGVANAELFSKVGFRWDFLLYSSVPVILGCYYVLKKKFVDKFYILILNTYILTNTVWILIIDVPFSNRFAYLSWFIMPLLIIYPFIKYSFILNRINKISIVLILYFGFTYLMNYL